MSFGVSYKALQFYTRCWVNGLWDSDPNEAVDKRCSEQRDPHNYGHVSRAKVLEEEDDAHEKEREKRFTSGV